MARSLGARSARSLARPAQHDRPGHLGRRRRPVVSAPPRARQSAAPARRVRRGHARVRKLVMMGTPVRGTWSALAGVLTLGLWSTSSWQLLPRSRFLDELAQGPIPPGVEVSTIAAARDWVVPLSTTRLSGANAMTVPLGHSSLVVSEEVYRRVVNTLRPPRDSLVDDPPATD